MTDAPAQSKSQSVVFSINARDGKARTAVMMTAYGSIHTPAFMPVGTQATVKAVAPEDVRATGAEILLANAYHLMLRPGAERVAQLGGLHHFMNWPRPILTDSGGFQAWSLADLRKINDEGITFRSHLDGSTHLLTPERAVEIQRHLDADISMALDECTPYPATWDVAAHSMERSMAWAKRCREAFQRRPGYGLFGIVQGGIYPDLRRQSAAALVETGFDGYALGGLAVGETREEMRQILDLVATMLPAERPRYLMGVGKPADIVAAVGRGIDMFDCVLPTRSGRTGQAFTRRGTVNIRNARHADDPRPLDEACNCDACVHYSRAYLHHLFKADEIFGINLLTRHNLQYYQDLMAGLRRAIGEGRYRQFASDFTEQQDAGDIPALDD